MPSISGLPAAAAINGTEILAADQTVGGITETVALPVTAILDQLNSDAGSLQITLNTTGDTATDMPAIAAPIGSMWVQIVSGFVVAQNTVTGASIAWQVIAFISMPESGTAVFFGDQTNGDQAPNPSLTLVTADPAMESCNLTANVESGAFTPVVTGLADTSINWFGSFMTGGGS